jgi:DNA-directed RNA polymerase subunit M/transcription elongation factor TFIIS
MAYFVSGCVQVKADKYQHKCDKCGNLENIIRTIPKLSSGTTNSTYYRCNKCGTNNKVIIKG